jgi:dTDP-3,4-didehydro-2,6-dideoxy-alpha-D-glucose 3-reductase
MDEHADHGEHAEATEHAEPTGRPDQSRPLRFGVLGCADIGWRRTLPAMVEEPSVTVTAVASRDPEKAAAFAQRFGAEPVTGYAELLARDDVDAVYVPLPTGLHAEWVGRALESGKHVLSEKPLCADSGQAERLLLAARERGLLLWENLTFVHHPQHRAIRELVTAGELGEVRSVSAVFGIPPLPPTDIRYRPELGGGALLDLGPYVAQTALLFLGPELEVVGATLRTDPGSGVDVAGAALLRSATGATAHLAFGFEHTYASAYTIWGDTGRLELDRAYTPPPDWVPTLRIHRQTGTEVRDLQPENQFRASARSFAEAVRLGEPRPLDLVHILRRAALLDEIRERAGVPAAVPA